MSTSNKLRTFNVKKDKKMQAKKRKLEAFLNLVRHDELSSVPGKKKSGGTFQENYKALKDELKKYQKKDTGDPSFSLKDDGRCALVNFSSNGELLDSSLPLFLEDIHNLLLLSVLGNLSPFALRWAKLQHAQNVSKTVLIEIEGLSQQNVIELNSELDESCLFPFVAEIVSSNIPFATDLSTMHLTTSLCSQKGENYSSIFPVELPGGRETVNTTTEYNISKLHLLLSPIQLTMEHYPLPQSVFQQSKSKGYCFTKDKYSAVHDKSPMFAIDCEMCRTVSGNEVTRVAIVNENLETIYHTLVKPKDEIVDYVTRFSGITEKMLRNVTTTLDDVQKHIRDNLPSDAILCGQSLNFDLHCLKIIHPYVIDTSIIFNEYGMRHKKSSLKQLVHIHLKERIQDGKSGHNPIEDSIATMKLVQFKLKNCIEFGDAVLLSDQNHATTCTKIDTTVESVIDKKNRISNLIKSNPDAKNNGFFSRISRFSKKTCLIGCENSLNNYCEEMVTDDITKVTKAKTMEITKSIADNVENYNLIISHLVLDSQDCSIRELKNEIKQIYATFPNKTLFTILMSGVNKQPDVHFKHSFCMVTLKK